MEWIREKIPQNTKKNSRMEKAGKSTAHTLATTTTITG